MKSTPFKILLIESEAEQQSYLKELLREAAYLVETVEKPDLAIKKVLNQEVDLVICKNTRNEYSGFEIFKILKKYLRNVGIPFFLILDSPGSEDIVLGLEMGIDNFIFNPINQHALFCKIENHLRKTEELNIFQTSHFFDHFKTSVVAMVFVDNNKVVKVNEAFRKLHNGCSSEVINQPFADVFNVTNSKNNELNFRRFQNGIINECQLSNVSCKINHDFSFDINFFRGKHLNSGVYFAELMPAFYTHAIAGAAAGNHHDTNGLNGANNAETDDLLRHQSVLTDREYQIFELSAQGLPIKLIAHQLNLSERTVEKHRANIMSKTNAKNMIEAIVKIRSNGD